MCCVKYARVLEGVIDYENMHLCVCMWEDFCAWKHYIDTHIRLAWCALPFVWTALTVSMVHYMLA